MLIGRALVRIEVNEERTCREFISESYLILLARRGRKGKESARERGRDWELAGAGAKLTTGGAICSFYPGVAFLVSDAGQAGREWKLLT